MVSELLFWAWILEMSETEKYQTEWIAAINPMLKLRLGLLIDLRIEWLYDEGCDQVTWPNEKGCCLIVWRVYARLECRCRLVWPSRLFQRGWIVISDPSCSTPPFPSSSCYFRCLFWQNKWMKIGRYTDSKTTTICTLANWKWSTVCVAMCAKLWPIYGMSMVTCPLLIIIVSKYNFRAKMLL